jgi:hypothetical protein
MNRVAITAVGASRNYQMRHERVSDCGLVAVEECELIGWISGNHKVGVWARLAAHEDMDENWMCLYIVKLFVAPERTSQGVDCRLIEEFERDVLPAAISSLSFQMNQQT